MINYTEPVQANFIPRFHPMKIGVCTYYYTEFGSRNVAKVYMDLHKTILENLELLGDAIGDFELERAFYEGKFMDTIDAILPFVYDVDVETEDWTKIYQHLSNEWFLSTHMATVEEQETLRTMDYNLYLKSTHWRIVRYSMILLHGANCEKCGRDNMWKDLSSLHVHHVTYKRRGVEHQKDLRLLCADCHAIEHGLATEPPPDDLGWLTVQQRRTYSRRASMGQGDEYLRDMWEIHEGRMTYSDLAKRHQVKED